MGFNGDLMVFDGIYDGISPGKHTKNYGKSQVLMGESTN